MSERASTVFRPEALRRYAEARTMPTERLDGIPSRLLAIWALVALALVVGVLSDAGRELIAGATGGVLPQRGEVPVATAAGLLGALAAAAVGLALAFGLRRRGRVPVLVQMSQVECGAACLAMVLSFHGRRTRVAECADRLGVGRDGLTARAIAEEARGFGMRVRAFSLEPSDLGQLQLPAIVHWEFNHFLVLERWSRGRVDIVDPGSGRRRLSLAEFDAGFTGVALVCEPGDDFSRRAARAPHRLRQLRSFAWAHRAILGQILAASLLLQLLGVALPMMTKLIVDDVLPMHDRDVLAILAGAVAVLVLGQGLLSYLRGMLLVTLRARLDGSVVPTLLERLLALPYRYFEQRQTGDLVARISSVSLIRDTLTNQMTSAVLDGTLAVGYVVLVLAQDRTMGIAVFALGLAQALLITATGPRVRDLTRRELAADAAAQSHLVEALSGVATLKASGTEERAHRYWSGLFHHHVAAGVRHGRLTAAIDAALAALRVLGPLGLIWLGASRVLDGEMTLGTMLATTALAAGALLPLSSLIANAQQLQLLSAYLDRLADIMLAEPEQDPANRLTPPTLAGAISLDRVSFRFDRRSPLVVRDVSIDIAAGQTVAIVGRSGSGKSTLGKLLLGLYEPEAGEVRYDGAPARGLDRHLLRRQLGVVLQEPVLFSGSIRENIAFNDPGVALERVVVAARMAEIHEDVTRMPMGYETPLSEGGAGLSGGQRQRIALARALLHRPAALFLDEATSHLDVATEAAVDRHLRDLACTRIIIAHRLSTVRDADAIIVMEAGQVVERGTHEELLALDGAYAALCESSVR